MNYMENARKGFTLIELLVVIGIVAILSVVVVLTVNPAELLRQARDSNRISDLGTIKAALSLYLSDASTPVLAGSYTTCYKSNLSVSTTKCGTTGINWFATTGPLTAVATSTVTANRAVNGTGWLGASQAAAQGPDFSAISSGAPLGTLPVDPLNNAANYYAYAASSTLVFEINTDMESSRYKQGGTSDVESTDGGDHNQIYEVGTAPGLSL